MKFSQGSAPRAHQTAANPDLAAVVNAWPKLPAAMKAGILAMVKAANSGK